ncbi:MAG: FGGY-family carbohydrate kinase [Leptospirales bacterium]
MSKQTPIEDTLILAVDLGTSGCKTALVDLSGRVRGWEFAPVDLHVIAGHGAEQNPEDWWRALLTTAERLIQKSAVDPRTIAAVCCSTQGECTVPVDEQGRALMNAQLWMDMRGEGHIKRRARGPISFSGYDVFKLTRWIRLTGGAPALSGKDPAGHMLFIKEEFPEVYQRTYKFLGALDFLNLRLTGRFVATRDSILTSWVTDNRRPNDIRYDDALIQMSGIAREKFPDIVACTDVIGRVLPEVATQLGLSPETRVVAGAIDTTAAAIGSGAIADKEAHLYIGTSSWIAAHVPRKKTDVISSMASVPCALPDKYLMIATQTTAGGNLSYLKERILYHQDELLQEQGVPDVYKILDRIAARTPAGSRGLIYMPWLYGERCPVDDGSLRAGLFNLSLEHSREDMIRAFLEGVALNTRWMLKPVERFLGRKLETITIAGGGGASDIWCEIFADVLGVTIRQLDQPVQANAIGSTGIAGVGLGLIDFSELSARTRYRRHYEPHPRRAQVYDRSFETYTELHRRLQPLYKKLNPKLAHHAPTTENACEPEAQVPAGAQPLEPKA